ncbi:MAG TPA: hypothetical protein VHN80_06725, partial [Kineosporiaceae bacterium]|nr:hypothetical protein [Kineosporiaceae bacterium]
MLAVTVSAGSSGPGSPVRPDPVAESAARRYDVDLARVLGAEKVTGRAGDVVRVPVQAGPDLP